MTVWDGRKICRFRMQEIFGKIATLREVSLDQNSGLVKSNAWTGFAKPIYEEAADRGLEEKSWSWKSVKVLTVGDVSKVRKESWKHSPRWWFQLFFFLMFTSIWWRFPFWLIFFRWVATTNQSPFLRCISFLRSKSCPASSRDIIVTKHRWRKVWGRW